MLWLIIAVLIWLIALLIVRFSGLKRLWSAAVWSILISYYLYHFLLEKGFYYFPEPLYLFQGIPILFPVAMGGLALILLHFLPEEGGWQLLYLVLSGAVLTLLELLAQWQGLIYYQNWALYDNFAFKLIIVITVAKLSNLTIKKQKGYLF